METNTETASISDSEQRGAGGKLRKPPSRRPPATPYARPQQRSRWLSKLVDPACRLISGGANRIFPSLFSRSSEYSLPAPDNQLQEDDYDKLDLEVQENACWDDDQCTITHGELGTSGVSGSNGPICTADRFKKGSGFDGCKQEKTVDLTDNDGLSEIEQLINGKTFSRDEINHLMEIIHSRVTDLPEVEQKNKFLTLTIREDANTPIAAVENARKANAEKQEDLNKALLGTSSAVLQSSMLDEVGASPIEIARAYMGIQMSEAGIGSRSLLTKDESASLYGDEFALKPFIPSPSPKPSICWPGAMLQDQRGYLTPQSERGRFGLHNFPRTPYSRTIFSKSKSKSKFTPLQGDGNRSLNMSFTPLQQSQTSIFEQSRRKTSDDGHGSVGPIRRLRQKEVIESPSRRSVNFRTSSNISLPAGGSNDLESFLPAVNLEPGGTSSSSIFQSIENKPASSEVSVPTVHPHSSQIARTILEHLERNPPTPKDKSAELKLAASWKKPQSSTVPAAMPKEQSSSRHLGVFDSSRSTDQGDKKNSAQWNEARANTFFKAPPPQENIKETKDSANGAASASNVKDGSMVMVLGDNVGPSEDFRNTLFSQIKSRHESDANTLLKAANSEAPNLRKPPSHSWGSKPVLPSISISNPSQNWTLSSDNTAGFTFPVSTASGVFSEPPTPSIMPLFSASGNLQQQNEGSAIPSYSFGSKKSTPALVFSFPSTSDTPPLDGDSDLKFNFGSDETRISFSSVGKDAICY